MGDLNAVWAAQEGRSGMLNSGGVLEGALDLACPGAMPRGPVPHSPMGMRGQDEIEFGFYINDAAALCFVPWRVFGTCSNWLFKISEKGRLLLCRIGVTS